LGSSIIDDHEKEEMEEAQRAAEARATQAEAERDFLAGEVETLKETIRTGLEGRLRASEAMDKAINPNGEQRDFIPAARALHKELADTKAALSASQAREAGMRAVLRLAAQWGISADGYHAFIATGLKRWIADGATGSLPDEVMDAARRNCHSELVAALSPAQPSQDRRILAPWNPCLEKLKDGEPFFVLLGRDEDAAGAVRYWADSRALRRGPSAKTAEARKLADQMDAYRPGLLTTETEVSNG
ncbi:hypothetical protein, partial [Azospirillum himalayense]